MPPIVAVVFVEFVLANLVPRLPKSALTIKKIPPPISKRVNSRNTT